MSTSRLRTHTPAQRPAFLILTFLVGMATCQPLLAMRHVGYVEVTSDTGRLVTLRQIPMPTLATVGRGTILEVMDKEGDWYWILLDPDFNGIRRAGWIRAGEVMERPDLPIATPAAPPSPQVAQAPGEATPPPSTSPVVESQDITVEEAQDLEMVLHFSFDSAELSVESRGTLDELARQLSAARSATIEIEGHTDSAGPSPYNHALGMRRAEAVRAYLSERHQIPLDLMNLTSFGEDAPTAPNDARQGRAQNRRVVIKY